MGHKSQAMPKVCVMPIRDENSITAIQDRIELQLRELGEEPPYFPDDYERVAKSLGINLNELFFGK